MDGVNVHTLRADVEQSGIGLNPASARRVGIDRLVYPGFHLSKLSKEKVPRDDPEREVHTNSAPHITLAKMGREIQKKKNRSGTLVKRRKPKSQKKILNNPIIAANWDKSQTITQNYKRLGLTSKLNKHTGGYERSADNAEQLEAGHAGRTRKRQDEDALSIAGHKHAAALSALGEAKIIRDPETGAILEVIETKAPNRNPLNDPLNDLDSSDDEKDELPAWTRKGNQHGNIEDGEFEGFGDDDGKTDVVRALEARASMPAKKYKRKQTENEVAFIEELVKKYGDDVGKMTRDIKINYMQRSEGDLKKRIKIWREAGGKIAGE
jgi:nucleolar protein 16